MPIRVLKVGLTLIGFVTAVVGLSGTPDDLARWREWFALFGELVFPDVLRGSLILSGIGLIIATNVPAQKWLRLGRQLRFVADRKYRRRYLVDCLGELRAEGVAVRNRNLPDDELDPLFRDWEGRCERVIRQLSRSDLHYFRTLDLFHSRVQGAFLNRVLDGKLQRIWDIMQRHDPDIKQ